MHTPSSSPVSRPALIPRTNFLTTPQSLAKLYLPTPPADNKTAKRRHPLDEKPVTKRLKFTDKDESTNEHVSESESESEWDSDEDVDMRDAATAQRARKQATYHLHTQFISNPISRCRRQAPSTLPILRSFVSSQKSDAYKCQSIEDDIFLTPPYACSYSHGEYIIYKGSTDFYSILDAKRGGAPLLAVATEQGTVSIIDTRTRRDWDSEPQRITFQPHSNAIFDVQWSLDDLSLATSSGDQSTRISDVRTGALTAVLRGHTGTVKCVAWDPTNPSLLASGGRDGSICLWDLRVGEKLPNRESIRSDPVITIYGAHEDTAIKTKPKARKGKQAQAPRTITSVLFPSSDTYGLVSSSSCDGVLKYWDLRRPETTRKARSAKSKIPPELRSSMDPTMLQGSRRPRGIISMTCGTGPTAGLIFALAADSSVHTYDLPTLSILDSTYSHEHLQTSSFYLGLSMSPCGRWLASGGSGNKGKTFLFDVERAAHPGTGEQTGIELDGPAAEVGAVDWAHNMLSTCADDGVVRVWRPDLEGRLKCLENPEESRWDWLWCKDSI